MQNILLSTDTITAPTTPLGRGGVGIIRVSGKQVATIAEKILGKLPKPRFAEFANFLAADGSIIDSGIALYFQAPHSFTGEDVLELQGHGGPVVMDCVLQRVISLGARMAKPGEFSERAFLNGKIDLAQAEAIADLIDASSNQAARYATRSLQGDFSKRIKIMIDNLIQLRMFIEATIDFTEEEIDFPNVANITTKLASILEDIRAVKSAAKQGVLMREGITVVIAGKPNVGKSSLLNRFSGQETAIVTEIPGTTRDVLRTHIQLDGIPIHLLDTAGIQETSNLVEQEGIKRAWNEIKQAQQILLLVDSNQDHSRDPKKIWHAFFGDLATQPKTTIIFNKIDLLNEIAHIEQKDGFDCIYLSAKTGAGFDLLKTHLKESLGLNNTIEGGFSARRRHLDALDIAEKNLLSAQNSLATGTLEILAEDLRRTQNTLNEITGEFTTEDLLDKIFSEFCIGK